MKDKISIIKELSSSVNLLYVEDNDGLRANMLKLLSRFFDNVLVSADGKEGYETFVQTKPQIIITDLNMPNLDGFGMIQKIMSLEPRSKVIVLSAFDEKQELHKAIQLGVFRFLHKPAKVPELVDAISDAVLSIQEEENRLLFSNQIKTIFNYQHSMVAMIHKEKFMLSNQRFLDFFELENLKKFEKKYQASKQRIAT
jgi:YesN/AraC family two-component response regulator